MTYRPHALLLLVVVLLWGSWAAHWFLPDYRIRIEPWERPAAVRPPVAPLEDLPLLPTTPPLEAVAEKPLFSPERRIPPPPPPPPPPNPLENTTVSGIVDGAWAGAILVVEGQVRRVAIGQTVGEWTLQAISPQGVTFVRAEEERTLPLVYRPLGVRNPPRP